MNSSGIPRVTVYSWGFPNGEQNGRPSEILLRVLMNFVTLDSFHLG